MTRVAVLGSGSWGTTLAVHLAVAGHEVRLWGVPREDLDRLEADRENRKFLPGIALPDGVKVRSELESALDGAETTLFVVPSQAMREVAERVAASGRKCLWVSASKGLDLSTGERMSQILTRILGDPEPVVLTGPSHAEGSEPRGADVGGRGVRERCACARSAGAVLHRSTPRLHQRGRGGMRDRGRAQERDRDRRRRLRRDRIR